MFGRSSPTVLQLAQTDRGVRRDIARVLRGVDSRHTLEAAEKLRGFDRPVLIAWAPEDRVFPFEHARRLAESASELGAHAVLANVTAQDDVDRCFSDVIATFGRTDAGPGKVIEGAVAKPSYVGDQTGDKAAGGNRG